MISSVCGLQLTDKIAQCRIQDGLKTTDYGAGKHRINQYFGNRQNIAKFVSYGKVNSHYYRLGSDNKNNCISLCTFITLKVSLVCI